MIDWYVILTPILLLPIFMLFFFVGCSLIFSSSDDDNEPVDDMNDDNSLVLGTFNISFYLQKDLLENIFRFTIYDQTEILTTKEGKVFEVDVGQGTKPSKVGYLFTHMFSPGMATLACQVHDTAVASGDPLIDKGNGLCVEDFDEKNEYIVDFVALVDQSGNEPINEFDNCNVNIQ